MRLATLSTYWGDRLAAQVEGQLLDLSAAYAARLEDERGLRRHLAVQQAQRAMPPEINDFLLAGEETWQHADDLVGWAGQALRSDSERLASCAWTLDAAPVTAVCPRPGKLWCMGANYQSHRREMAERAGREANPDQTPQGFIKALTAIVGPCDSIVYPPESKHVDFEMELAVVMGRGGRRIPEDRAMDHVFGYTVFNDVSARDIRILDNDRPDRSKGFDSFGVMGPWLVTKDEVADPHNLRLTLKLNGELCQDASTSDMVFRIPTCISWLSSAMTLEPGDIISTGTPPGVRPIKPGDLLEGEVENIGTIRNLVVAER